MSYDFSLKFDPQTYPNVEELINSKPHINNLIFSISDQYHMQIDIEKDASISFQIPYAFMEGQKVDHRKYLDSIFEIAQQLNADAFDLQENKKITDPLYVPPTYRSLVNLLNKRSFNKWKVSNEKISLFADDVKSTFDVDLKSYTVCYGVNLDYKEPSYPPFTNFKKFEQEDFPYFAIRNWTTKTVRIYEKSKLSSDLKEEEIWEQNFHRELKKCGKVKNVRFFLDGSVMTTSYRSNKLKLWDIKSNSVIQNFTDFSNNIFDFYVLNENILITHTSSGITFFDFSTSKFILHISPTKDEWFAFNHVGKYEGNVDDRKVYELDYKDNKHSESFCFVPNLGFAVYRPATKWKLYKVKRLVDSQPIKNIIKETLGPYIL